MRIIPLDIRNEKDSREIMSSLGVSPEGIRILSPKSVYTAFKIDGIRSWEANIIKQQLLSLGGGESETLSLPSLLAGLAALLCAYQLTYAALPALSFLGMADREGKDRRLEATIDGNRRASALIDRGELAAAVSILDKNYRKYIEFFKRGRRGAGEEFIGQARMLVAHFCKLANAWMELRAESDSPPGAGVDGLLGMTFLKDFHVRVDAKDNCLYLEKY